MEKQTKHEECIFKSETWKVRFPGLQWEVKHKKYCFQYSTHPFSTRASAFINSHLQSVTAYDTHVVNSSVPSI